MASTTSQVILARYNEKWRRVYQLSRTLSKRSDNQTCLPSQESCFRPKWQGSTNYQLLGTFLKRSNNQTCLSSIASCSDALLGGNYNGQSYVIFTSPCIHRGEALNWVCLSPQCESPSRQDRATPIGEGFDGQEHQPESTSQQGM